MSDLSTSDENHRPWREAHVSSVDVRLGEIPAERGPVRMSTILVAPHV